MFESHYHQAMLDTVPGITRKPCSGAGADAATFEGAATADDRSTPTRRGWRHPSFEGATTAQLAGPALAFDRNASPKSEVSLSLEDSLAQAFDNGPCPEQLDRPFTLDGS